MQYLGKTVQEQRVEIFKNDGLPLQLLNAYKKIEKIWPENVSYEEKGDTNQLSYIKYLLIPKIPKGSKKYWVTDSGTFNPKENIYSLTKQIEKPGSIISLIGSILFLGGISLMLKRFAVFSTISIPEAFGVAVFFCMVCTVISKIVFARCIPGFCVITFFGFLSWLWLIGEKIVMCKRSLKIFPICKFNCSALNRKDVGILIRYYSIIMIFLSVLWAFLMSVVVVPDDWDAWAIWGAKAKVLALGHGPLLDVSYFGHANYPLLWPSIWAYSGWLGGGWEEMWVRGWGSVFLLLCIWEIILVIERIIGRRDLGFLGGALFASVPMVPLIASWSYADIPLCYFFVVSFGCLISLKEKENNIHIVMASILAASAAYTKNEGVMFALLMTGFIPFVVRRNSIYYILVFIGLFSILYSPWIIWKDIIHHFPSSATTGLHFDLANLHRAWHRIPHAIDAIARMWCDIRQWNIVLWLSLLWFCIGLIKKESRKWQLIPWGMLIGYFIIIIFLTTEIYWQVGSSWNRLTVHTLAFLIIAMVVQFANIFPVNQD